MKSFWPPSLSAILGAVLCAVIAILALQLAWVRQDLQITSERLATANRQLADAQRDASAVAQAAQEISAAAKASGLAQAELRRQVSEVAAGVDRRLASIESIAARSAVARTWMEAPLPAEVSDLRLRPAISGAAAYRAWLTGSTAP